MAYTIRAHEQKKCGYPFLLRGVKLEKDDDWRMKVVCEFHNYRPAEQLEGHSFVGRLTKNEETLLKRYDEEYDQAKKHTYDHKKS